MRANEKYKRPGKEALAYLSGDRFMATMLHAEALSAAFAIGLVDCLISQGPASPAVLTELLSVNQRGMDFLLDILFESGVVERQNDIYSLSSFFAEALRFRELMEGKLALANFAAHDFLDGFVDLVARPDQFMQGSRFHRLFAYDRCSGTGEADRRVTARWMRITTLLTRYETAVCMDCHDFSDCRRMLDVGGNSGEFALHLCRQYPDMRATVFDLPLVCEVGRKHVATAPEADRIAFVTGDALTDTFPAGHDLLVFKSMLHDWPDDTVREFIKKAEGALVPEGRLLIFERAPMDVSRQKFSYAVLPFLIFFHSYRPAGTYVEFMKEAGFSEIAVSMIELEMPFMLITGRCGS